MTHKANHTIVIGKGADAKTIAAGESLPDLPADEIKRLRELGAIGPQAAASPVADAGAATPGGPLSDAAKKSAKA